MVYVIEETDIFKKLKSDKEKKEYCEVYLEGIAHLTYLEKYNSLDPDSPIGENLQPAFKTILGVSFLKDKIFSNDKVDKGKSEGYKDFIYASKDTLNMITNFVNASVSKKELQDFFE